MSEQVEEELYGLLAEWIALCTGLGPGMKVRGRNFRHKEINHWFMSVFEISCSLMWKLGLYKRSKEHPESLFYFAVSRSKLVQKAVSNKKRTGVG